MLNRNQIPVEVIPCPLVSCWFVYLVQDFQKQRAVSVVDSVCRGHTLDGAAL